MVELLSYINTKLTGAGIPYEFGEWSQAVSYPYFVGSYMETGYSYEDGCTSGAFTLDGWCRGSGAQLALSEMSDRIKALFDDDHAAINDRAFYISFSTSNPVLSGEDDLYRVTITINTKEWSV